jgi:hypothetical protein
MNPWKIATIGIALVAATALVTGVTTAYLLRPASLDAALPAEVPAAVAAAPARGVQPARIVQPAPAPPPVRRAAAAARPVAVSAPDDCATTGDRVWRVAKPGLVGGLVGAGLGAAGGAIVDGGSGAGKGALIGALGGAAAGGVYGAYRTKSECGTLLGDTGSFTTPWPAGGTVARAAAPARAAADAIAVYQVR